VFTKTTFCSVCGQHSTVVHNIRFRRMACPCGRTHLVCRTCYSILRADRTVLDAKRGKLWLMILPECPRVKGGQESLRIVTELMR
jgi:hypothetical protein